MLHKNDYNGNREQRSPDVAQPRKAVSTNAILCGDDPVNVTDDQILKEYDKTKYNLVEAINIISSNNYSNYNSNTITYNHYNSNNNYYVPTLATSSAVVNKAVAVHDPIDYDTALQSCIRYCNQIHLSANKCHKYLDMNSSYLQNLIFQKNNQINMRCVRVYNSTCENMFIHQFFVGYCFPVLLMICVTGNLLNLLVYMGKDMRKSTTVKMLMVKSVMNILFMMFLLPISLIQLSDGQNSLVDEVAIWSVWPYFTACSNITGFCAAWLTVLMTMERYLFIKYPLRSRRWCTTKHFCILFAVVFLVGCAIYIEVPLVRTNQSMLCNQIQKYVHTTYLNKDWWVPVWEDIYYWSSIITYVILPCILLTYCGVRSVYELIRRTMPTYSETKRCVTRITLATTCCHLALESPALLTYIIAAFNGPAFMNSSYSMCVCHVIINFAVQTNASVCFLIYMSCSRRFRAILYSRLKCASSTYGSKSNDHNNESDAGDRQGALLSAGHRQRQSEHLLMANNSSLLSHSPTPVDKDDEESEDVKPSTTLL